jgi:hypothetical protein
MVLLIKMQKSTFFKLIQFFPPWHLCPANIERASKVFKCLANNSDDLFAIKNEKLKGKEPKKTLWKQSWVSKRTNICDRTTLTIINFVTIFFFTRVLKSHASSSFLFTQTFFPFYCLKWDSKRKKERKKERKQECKNATVFKKGEK